MPLPIVSPRQAAQIRTVHQYGFRSGEWGDLLGVVVYRSRPCYVVAFHDDQTVRGNAELDLWPCADENGNYEFRSHE
jgi:hypothetical protein